uniref:Protein kinase domain-containing protein n=1 Tax=viral metagenome TaxID=1070528 RepID=A0A6C0KER4_9ZZZZ
MSESPSGIVNYTGDPLLFNEEVEDHIDLFDNEDNHHLPDFLEFHSSFPRSGKQGVLGLLKNNETGKKFVYKISQYLNFTIPQEYAVMEGLNTIREFCPHFCKAYGKFRVPVISTFRTADNPFEYSKRDTRIQTDVLLMEHIEDARKLYRYIKNDEITPYIIMSIVKQTLLADIIASEHLKFSHYDIHSNNVLVKKCKPNSVFFYILDETRTYMVPTYGYYPTIIDFGFSFNKNCDNRSLYGALAHTDIGFITATHDQHADAKLFLTSVSHEMKKYKKTPESKRFRKLISNVYAKCKIDLECGWDDREDERSISDHLLKRMSAQFKRSAFFKEQGHHIVDILQALVDLPLTTRHTTDTLEDMAGILVTEFLKIEKEISNDFYNMYILKSIVESCVRNRSLYIKKETRETGVANFKHDTLRCIDSIVKFCNPKINWEKLLCCLLCLSKCIENYCFDKLKKLLARKRVDYNNMGLRNTTEIYEAIEANLPSHFVFDKETDIYVWNCIEKRSYKIKLPSKMIGALNDAHPYERGIIFYEYVSSTSF